MFRWKVPISTLVVLIGMVCIMLLIVYLPDVDLPDTAFHQGTAPLVVHARVNAAPTVAAVASLFQFPDSQHFWSPEREREIVAGNLDPNFRPILLRSIRR
jgi:hypothetical protein